MKTPHSFMRIFYTILSVVLFTTYAFSTNLGQTPLLNIFIGIVLGVFSSAVMISAGHFLRNTDMKAITLTLIGLVFGFLISQTVWMIISSFLDPSNINVNATAALTMKTVLFLLSTYIGMFLTFKASEQFQSFAHQSNEKGNGGANQREVILDSSILADPRLIDIASSGLLDQQLVLPRFVLTDLYTQADLGDEHAKTRSKRSIDTFKKLELIPNLELRIIENDYADVKDVQGKLIRLAREHDGVIFTADVSRVQQLTIDGVKFININALSNALKPITQTGEILNIKIQRYGKEPRQGVGYLEDGTMVVVNSGAEYIGETIKAQVLSVKHTSSGRMIFCNAADENLSFDGESNSYTQEFDRKNKDYMSL